MKATNLTFPLFPVVSAGKTQDCCSYERNSGDLRNVQSISNPEVLSQISTNKGATSFRNVRINLAGRNYAIQLGFQTSSFQFSSDWFEILPGAPVQISFSQLPNEATAQTVLSEDIVIVSYDNLGNYQTVFQALCYPKSEYLTCAV